MNDRLAQVAHRFPLIPRPQPARLPVHQRIAEIAQLAATPPGHPDAASRIATAHNKAALIASDSGDPDFARALCWQHHDRYADQRPWDAATARRALEPLVNLARLHIRDHQPDTAVAVLESLLTATRHAGIAQVDRRPVYLDHNTVTSHEARQQVHRWLWTVVVADGIRALTRADRWDDALAHACAHRGIGDTLLDGRQTAVIAHARRGELDSAQKILNASVVDLPWQRAVHACLELATQENAESPEGCSSAALRLIECCAAEPLRFRINLLTTVADLNPSPSRSTGAVHSLANQVAESGDASLAGILLRNRIYRELPKPVQLALRRIHARTFTATDARDQLSDALHLAELAVPLSESKPEPDRDRLFERVAIVN